MVKLCETMNGSRGSYLVEMFYRYQTGALTPLIRWLSQGMQGAAAPPHPPRPAARDENAPPARQGVDNAAPAGIIGFHFMHIFSLGCG